MTRAVGRDSMSPALGASRAQGVDRASCADQRRRLARRRTVGGERALPTLERGATLFRTRAAFDSTSSGQGPATEPAVTVGCNRRADLRRDTVARSRTGTKQGSLHSGGSWIFARLRLATAARRVIGWVHEPGSDRGRSALGASTSRNLGWERMKVKECSGSVAGASCDFA